MRSRAALRAAPRRATSAAFATALCAASPAARADDDATLAACRAEAVSTYAIMDCQKAALARAEAALEAAYGKAMAALPPDRKAKLLEAERRWVAFRRADCETYYGAQTGTIAGIAGGDCMIRHAQERVRDLATFFEP